jgi:hypothetical protein
MRTKSANSVLSDLSVRIGARWRNARKIKNLTLDDVCLKLREYGYFIHKASLANFELGTSQPFHVMVLIGCLSAMYGVTPNMMLGQETEEPKQEVVA